MRTYCALLIGLMIGIVFSSAGLPKGRVIESAVPNLVAEASAAHPETEIWSADELMEIARYYDTQADTVQAQAVAFERTAAAITPLTDTKGFRRSGLMIAASSRWREAAELRQQAVNHRGEASRLLAKSKSD
jgi:hypothetical protein